MKNFARVILILTLVSSLAAALILFRFSYTTKEELTISVREVPSSTIIDGFQFTEYDSGQKCFSIRARTGSVYGKKVRPLGFRVGLGRSFELEDVTVTFYKDGSPIAYLTSLYAVMDKTNKNIAFEGNPVVITKERRVLDARQIIWDNTQRRFIAKGNCLFSADGEARRADIVHADFELKDVSTKSKKSLDFKFKII